MRHFLFGVFFLTQLACFGQIIEDFGDGDFTNPNTGPFPLSWQGMDTNYLVNPSFQLQLNAPALAGTSFLSLEHQMPDFSTSKEWSFWTQQLFNPSGSNNGRIYLTSSSVDLTSDPNGFYIQLGEGGSTDAVRLMKALNSTHTEIVAGTNGQIDYTNLTARIRVVRSASAEWTLSVDLTGGTNYLLIGTATDNEPLLGTYAGVLNNYTGSNSGDFFYDDIYIGDEIMDTVPPVLLSATTINSGMVDALFNEELDPGSAGDMSNYNIADSSLAITNVELDISNPALVHISTAQMTNGYSYELTTNLIEDILGNISGAQTEPFAYLIAETPEVGDVIINEVMFDPSDPIGQPEVDYVEIYNRSTKIFNVEDWKIGDSGSDGTIEAAWLLPDSYMLLTISTWVDSFSVAATGVGSFPNFNSTTADNVVLRSNTGLRLDSITYLDESGIDIEFFDGVSIELINPNDPCSDASDWRSSTDSSGGTPGAQNSVYDTIPDTTNPEIAFLLAIPLDGLIIYYNEGMDSTSLANATITITPSLGISNNFVPTDPSSTQTFQFDSDLVGSQTYTIEIQNVGDCWGNITTLIGEFALPETASLGDLVINELLVDPVSGGKDWIELYNNSDKLIDLFNYQIADYDDDTIANFKTIEEHILIGPDEYIVLGEDIAQIAQHYPTTVPDNLYEMDLPSYSNDSGTVYLIQNNLFTNIVMDRVAYSDDWHFRLLDNTDGVSLERIEPDGGSSDSHNWHSAAEAIGFATPGLVNSQYYPSIENGEFDYTNDVVSPDSDGYQDVLQINYQLLEPGYVGHFTVYDDRGRLIARVVESELLGASGTFSWGGVRDDGTKASIGTYVGVFEAFQLEGGVVFTDRKAFVVAGKI